MEENVKIKVKTIWGGGMVSVADKYIREALARRVGLEIELNGVVMTITYDKLINKKPREGNFKDKFGRKNKEYKLYDFFWEKQ